MKKRLYVAYGSNLNLEQMKHRCPTAKLYGTGVIEDYELQFKGHPSCAFATIAPKDGSSVPVAVWEIKPSDEMALDRYEGYPSHYFKQDVPVKLEQEEVEAMVYIMNQRMDFGMPSAHYYQVVYEGYNDCGLNPDILLKAAMENAEHFYSAVVSPSYQQSLSDADGEDEYEEDEYEEDEYEDEEEQLAEDDEMEESGPSYSGIQM